jgi:hypothetical protein
MAGEGIVDEAMSNVKVQRSNKIKSLKWKTVGP